MILNFLEMKDLIETINIIFANFQVKNFLYVIFVIFLESILPNFVSLWSNFFCDAFEFASYEQKVCDYAQAKKKAGRIVFDEV